MRAAMVIIVGLLFLNFADEQFDRGLVAKEMLRISQDHSVRGEGMKGPTSALGGSNYRSTTNVESAGN